MDIGFIEQMSIFSKNNGTCHLCGGNINLSAYGSLTDSLGWEVDHARPQSLGGSDRLANLWPAHPACNRSRQDIPLSRLFR